MGKHCVSCGRYKTSDQFETRRDRPGTRRNTCVPCRVAGATRSKERNPDGVRASRRKAHLKRAYRMTPEQFDEKKEAQGSCCALCDKPAADLVVDHCHTSGKVRDLLCDPCNRALGHVENAEFLAAALAYLDRHKESGL